MKNNLHKQLLQLLQRLLDCHQVQYFLGWKQLPELEGLLDYHLRLLYQHKLQFQEFQRVFWCLLRLEIVVEGDDI